MKGGLVVNRHEEIKMELAHLGQRATPGNNMVRNEPEINPLGRCNDPADPENPQDKDGNRGDLLIRGLWEDGTDCIIDVRCTDINSDSNINKDPDKVLKAAEKEKKNKYLKACQNQRRHFSPFVVSTCGLIANEGKHVLRQIASKIAKASDKPFSVTSNFVKCRMSIAIIRATQQCVRGSRISVAKISSRFPVWGDHAAGVLYSPL
jgi:hypothetical protein